LFQYISILFLYLGLVVLTCNLIIESYHYWKISFVIETESKYQMKACV